MAKRLTRVFLHIPPVIFSLGACGAIAGFLVESYVTTGVPSHNTFLIPFWYALTLLFLSLLWLAQRIWFNPLKIRRRWLQILFVLSLVFGYACAVLGITAYGLNGEVFPVAMAVLWILGPLFGLTASFILGLRKSSVEKMMKAQSMSYLVGESPQQRKRTYAWPVSILRGIVKAIIAAYAGFMVIFGMGLLTFQAIGEIYEIHNVPPPGQLFEIKDPVDSTPFSLHIYCTEPEDPVFNGTVVLLHAGGTSSASMLPVQRRLTESGFSTCSYDRAGFGWSMSGPLPGTEEQNIANLRRLLDIAGVLKPYFLVGHSLGGQEALGFTKEYERDVAGVALVDSYPQLLWEMRVSDILGHDEIALLQERRRNADVGRFFYGPLGIARMIWTEAAYYGIFGEEDARRFVYNYHQAETWNSLAMSLETPDDVQKLYDQGNGNVQNDDNFEQLAPGQLDDKPMLMLVAGSVVSENPQVRCKGLSPNDPQCEEHIEVAKMSHRLAERQSEFSSTSRMVVCEHPCTHDMQWTHPDFVTEEIIRFIQEDVQEDRSS